MQGTSGCCTLHLCLFEKHHNLWITFDLSVLDIDHILFPQQDWTCFYGNVKELIPLNTLEPLGLPVIIHIFMDSDHAGDAVTR